MQPINTITAATWYLAGIIDGEGNIKNDTRQIRIRVCDRDIMEAVVVACDILDISYKIYWDRPPKGLGTQNVHELNINGYHNIKKVFDTVPIQNVVKRNRLEYAVNGYQTIYASKADDEKLLRKVGLL